MATDPSQDLAVTDVTRAGDEIPSGTPGSGDDVCPRCNGSGKMEGQECEFCSGTGIITRAIGGG
jgi:DnaJ-class molecular chaperone